MAKKKRGSLKPTLDNFGAALKEVLDGITEELYERVDRGLDKAANYAQDKLEAATPEETEGATGQTRSSWETNFNYTNVRYINNTRVNDQGIPVVNLLEFGSRGKPFIRKTIEAEQENIINIIKGEIENVGTE